MRHNNGRILLNGAADPLGLSDIDASASLGDSRIGRNEPLMPHEFRSFCLTPARGIAVYLHHTHKGGVGICRHNLFEVWRFPGIKWWRWPFAKSLSQPHLHGVSESASQQGNRASKISFLRVPVRSLRTPPSQSQSQSQSRLRKRSPDCIKWKQERGDPRSAAALYKHKHKHQHKYLKCPKSRHGNTSNGDSLNCRINLAVKCRVMPCGSRGSLPKCGGSHLLQQTSFLLRIF